MKMYIANLFPLGGEATLLGVFSTEAKAIGAGKDMIRELTDYEPVELDWARAERELVYYYFGYTLTITECELDKPV